MQAMKNKYNKQCPNSNDFETYLNDSGTINFRTEFDAHLKICPLCSESIEGYQKTSIKNTGVYKKPAPNFANPYGRSIRIYKQLGYAATILLVLGMVSYSLWFPKNPPLTYAQTPVYEFSGNELTQQNGLKKIMSKQHNNQYWYIGSNDKLAVNDYFIKPSQVSEALYKDPSTKSILVQVENSDNRFNQQIIQQLKNQQKAPVYSFSSSRDIKKLTSWEGM
jgi:hypothetical protein